ncbi:KCNAW protein, partial [Acromyrmex charruanus]
KKIKDGKWNDGVTLNVGGVRHETYKVTLKKISATRLSRLTDFFAQVLNYYRTEKLYYLADICSPLFKKKLKFWDHSVIPIYSIHQDTQVTLAILNKLDVEDEKLSDEEIAQIFNFEDNDRKGTLMKEQRLRSRIAKHIACVSIFFIHLSVFRFCVKNHAPVELSRDKHDCTTNLRNDHDRGTHSSNAKSEKTADLTTPKVTLSHRLGHQLGRTRGPLGRGLVAT